MCEAKIDRRAALGALGLLASGAAAGALPGVQAAAAQPGDARSAFAPSDLGWDAEKGEYVLPPLPYAPDALEPHIDAATMEIHHGKHHAAYVAGLNRALAELARIRAGEGDAGLIKHWSRELAFHGGGHVNHCLFWLGMAPSGAGGGGQPGGALGQRLARDFGSFERFAAHFQAAAVGVEGSGWAWLVLDTISGRLWVQQMEKQQNLLVTGVVPLLGCDVWEHAYYLRHQNRRGDYVKAWMNVVNWAFVERLYERAI